MVYPHLVTHCFAFSQHNPILEDHSPEMKTAVASLSGMLRQQRAAEGRDDITTAAVLSVIANDTCALVSDDAFFRLAGWLVGGHTHLPSVY